LYSPTDNPKTDIISSTEILTAIIAMPLNVIYDYTMEVTDKLIYYLVNAVCFMVISTVANFYEQIHYIQDMNLTSYDRSFTLCKRAFVPLLRTSKKCYEYIQHLKNNYILFDEEYNRIARGLNKTKFMVKEINTSLYLKLSLKCYREIENIWKNHRLLDHSSNCVVVKFSVCVGICGQIY
jgi:hypothetical protein